VTDATSNVAPEATVTVGDALIEPAPERASVPSAIVVDPV